MTKYLATFIEAENERLEIPSNLEKVSMSEADIMEAVRTLDRKLYNENISFYADDFETYNESKNNCEVVFKDECGMPVLYKIKRSGK